MTRSLIFLASLLMTFVTIATASSASPVGLVLHSTLAERPSGGHWSAAALAVTPSRLSMIDIVGL
jgi:hypothetical protein